MSALQNILVRLYIYFDFAADVNFSPFWNSKILLSSTRKSTWISSRQYFWISFPTFTKNIWWKLFELLLTYYLRPFLYCDLFQIWICRSKVLVQVGAQSKSMIWRLPIGWLTGEILAPTLLVVYFTTTNMKAPI